MNHGGVPTARQVYALAAVLCELRGEEWPADRGEASELLERLRLEAGHPAPRLEDVPLHGRRGRGGRWPRAEERALHERIVDELLR